MTMGTRYCGTTNSRDTLFEYNSIRVSSHQMIGFGVRFSFMIVHLSRVRYIFVPICIRVAGFNVFLFST